MEATQLTRQFKLKNRDTDIMIPDPNPAYSLDQVAEFLSEDYPEVTNAVLGQPTEKDGMLTYEITSTFGTKG
jgi:PRTRC genetic system protein C